MDPLTALLGLIPPPWNAVAVFGLGILTKWLHGRISPPPTPAPTPAPAPAPSGTPLLDLLLNVFRQKLAPKPVAEAVAQDIDHATVAKLLKALEGDRIAG